MNYYNDNEKTSAAWLRNLIKEGLIPNGEVDERSIADIEPKDLTGFVQCHFFAGIGGWPYALRLAGWPDDRPVWTGSCPCQPFSVAGKGEGTDDDRHLWPAFRWLIANAERKPAVIFGEQVASKDGRLWLAGVRSDLEAMGYAVGAADLCAAGVSAPHIRQRFYWVGKSDRNRPQTWDKPSEGARHRNPSNPTGGTNSGWNGGCNSGLVNSDGYHRHWWGGPVQVGWNAIEAEIERGGRKYRAKWRIKPGVSIVAHGVSNRVAKLCGLGNAIVPQVAAEFIRAYLAT